MSQLAERLGESAERIIEAISCSRAPLSLTSEYDDEGNPQLDLPSPDIQYEISERLSLDQALRSLDEGDRALINFRYYQGKTQTETAKLLNMTQVQVSRREKKILAQIRKNLVSA